MAPIDEGTTTEVWRRVRGPIDGCVQWDGICVECRSPIGVMKPDGERPSHWPEAYRCPACFRRFYLQVSAVEPNPREATHAR